MFYTLSISTELIHIIILSFWGIYEVIIIIINIIIIITC